MAHREATGSLWNTTSDNQITTFNTRIPLEDDNGVQVTDESNRPLYILPPGGYFADGFTGGTQTDIQSNFLNELGPNKASPSEGFADTFSHFILDRQTLENLSTPRFSYFDENMKQWIRDILCQNGTIECK